MRQGALAPRHPSKSFPRPPRGKFLFCPESASISGGVGWAPRASGLGCTCLADRPRGN